MSQQDETPGGNAGATPQATTVDAGQKDTAVAETIDPKRTVLSGTDSLFDGKPHVGITVDVSASGKASRLVISDVASITDGAPVYITGPIELQGANLMNYLKAKGTEVPPKAARFINSTSIGCRALYLTMKQRTMTKEEVDTFNATPGLKPEDRKAADAKTDDGAVLMVFDLDFKGKDGKGGLIEALTDDKDLGKLFDIKGASMRILKCPSTRKTDLVNYVNDTLS